MPDRASGCTALHFSNASANPPPGWPTLAEPHPVLTGLVLDLSQRLLPRQPRARLHVGMRDGGVRRRRCTGGVLPEGSVCDMHRVVCVERHHHAVDLLRVTQQQLSDSLRVRRRAGNCERAALVEVDLRARNTRALKSVRGLYLSGRGG